MYKRRQLVNHQTLQLAWPSWYRLDGRDLNPQPQDKLALKAEAR